MKRTSVICIHCGVRWEQHREDLCEAGALGRDLYGLRDCYIASGSYNGGVYVGDEDDAELAAQEYPDED